MSLISMGSISPFLSPNGSPWPFEEQNSPPAIEFSNFDKLLDPNNQDELSDFLFYSSFMDENLNDNEIPLFFMDSENNDPAKMLIEENSSSQVLNTSLLDKKEEYVSTNKLYEKSLTNPGLSQRILENCYNGGLLNPLPSLKIKKIKQTNCLPTHFFAIDNVIKIEFVNPPSQLSHYFLNKKITIEGKSLIYPEIFLKKMYKINILNKNSQQSYPEVFLKKNCLHISMPKIKSEIYSSLEKEMVYTFKIDEHLLIDRVGLCYAKTKLTKTLFPGKLDKIHSQT